MDLFKELASLLKWFSPLFYVFSFIEVELISALIFIIFFVLLVLGSFCSFSPVLQLKS